MSARSELRQAKADLADLAYWEAIFRPLGYRVHGWTYRNTALVVSPTGKYLSVDEKTVELVAAALAAGLHTRQASP